MNTIQEIRQERERWGKSAFKESSQRKDVFKTSSDIEIKSIYTPEDFSEKSYLDALGFPGEYPFTRGIHPGMYRGKLWTMRQYAGYGTAEETNERFKYLLRQGQTGLSIAFDLPTQMGYDSDHPLAMGEVGKVGVAIDSLLDLETLFQDIPLKEVSTSMTINATGAILLAMYMAAAERQGVNPKELRGTTQNDILKEYIARGTYIFPPKESIRITTDIFAFCKENLPLWNTISISGYHIREAGATAVQEVAFTLANAITYLRAALEVGLQVDEIAPRLSFFFNSHNNLLEEVAKFRAARRLWAKIMKEKFNSRDSRSQVLRFHAQTAGSTLTAQQPDNNIVRVTIQALAAILGGAQSLHTNSKDEALALPSEEAARIALRTQQILAHETRVADCIDPLGGSYFVESLTNQIEQKAMEYIEKIESMGGMVEAINSGYVQREIENSAYEYQRTLEEKRQIIVGVNEYQSEDKIDFELLRVDPELEKKQVKKLRNLRSTRNNKLVIQSLEELKEAAKENRNLMPYILNTVKKFVTLGEISHTLCEVFGRYKDNRS